MNRYQLFLFSLLLAACGSKHRPTLTTNDAPADPPSIQEARAEITSLEKQAPPSGNGSQDKGPRDAAVELAKPGAESEQIPVDEKKFAPFETRGESREQQKQWREICNVLWTTPLGQMFHHYLTAPVPPTQVASISRQFVHRIDSDGGHAVTRKEALVLLKNDMYVRGQVTPEVQNRLMILSEDLRQTADAAAANTKSTAQGHALAFLLAVMPFGLPAVEETAVNLGRYGLDAGKHVVKLDVRGVPKFDWKAVRGDKPVFRHGYNVTRPITMYFGYFGAYSMGLFQVKDWVPSFLGRATKDTEMLNGMDELINKLQN